MGIRLGIGGLKIGQRSGTAAVPFDWSSYWSPQYYAVWNAKVIKPSLADATLEAAWLDGMVAGGYFAKAQILDMLSCDTAANSLFNWKDPMGAHNPSMVNAPTFTPYAGFTGINAGGHCIRTHFKPSTDSVIAGLDSFCIMMGIGTSYGAGVESGEIMGCQGPTGNSIKCRFHAVDNNQYVNLNQSTQNAITLANGNAKHWAINRPDNTQGDVFNNATKVNYARASTALPPTEIYVCAFNSNGTITAQPCNIRYFFIFSKLTDGEITAIRNLTEAYLDAHGTGLI